MVAGTQHRISGKVAGKTELPATDIGRVIGRIMEAANVQKLAHLAKFLAHAIEMEEGMPSLEARLKVVEEIIEKRSGQALDREEIGK